MNNFIINVPYHGVKKVAIWQLSYYTSSVCGKVEKGCKLFLSRKNGYRVSYLFLVVNLIIPSDTGCVGLLKRLILFSNPRVCAISKVWNCILT